MSMHVHAQKAAELAWQYSSPAAQRQLDAWSATPEAAGGDLQVLSRQPCPDTILCAVRTCFCSAAPASLPAQRRHVIICAMQICDSGAVPLHAAQGSQRSHRVVSRSRTARVAGELSGLQGASTPWCLRRSGLRSGTCAPAAQSAHATPTLLAPGANHFPATMLLPDSYELTAPLAAQSGAFLLSPPPGGVSFGASPFTMHPSLPGHLGGAANGDEDAAQQQQGGTPGRPSRPAASLTTPAAAAPRQLS